MKKRLKMQCFALFFLLCVGGIAHAQIKEQTVTVNLQNATLSKVFSVIEKQTTYHFSYRDLVIDNKSDITISKTSVPVSEVLNTVLAGRNLEYTIISSKSIVITDKQVNAKGGGGSVKKVSGSIKDEKGEPIIGALIKNSSSNTGVMSDTNGKFILEASEESILTVSYIGYKTKRIIVKSNDNLNIVLDEDVRNLDEVVVVGYGTQRKINLTGSVQSIGSNDIVRRSVSNGSNALQGLVPGLTAVQTSGQPGNDQSSLKIRGLGSLNSTVSPLILIDGVEGDMNRIDLNSIESVSVLKDVASASIYGSRASNGVILITTKRGKNGKIKVSFNGYTGVNKPTSLPEETNAVEYMTAMDQARLNNNETPLYTDIIEIYKNGGVDNLNYYDTNWRDEVIKSSGTVQNYSVNVSGGSENLKVYASAGNYSQKGLIDNNTYARTTASLNSDMKVNKWLSIGLDMNMRQSVAVSPVLASPTTIIGYALTMTPIMSGINADGTWGYGINGTNPIAMVRLNDCVSKSIAPQYITKASMVLTPFKGITINGSYSWKRDDSETKAFVKPYDTYENGVFKGSFPTTGSSASEQRSKSVLKQYNLTGTYENTFGKHYFKGMLGYQSEELNATYLITGRKNYEYEGYTDIVNGDASTASNSSSRTAWSILSYLYRLNYSFNDKYLLEINGRFDGTSRFISKNRWGFFPSVSAGWRVSQENFWKYMPKQVESLKLRASYGILGNQSISGYYPYSAAVGSATEYGYWFDKEFSSGVAQIQLANPDITWEKSRQINVGLDFSMLHSRLNGTFDYYVRNIYDMLQQFPVPLFVGMTTPWSNAGSMSNNGWELTLSWNDYIGNVKYSVSGNLSDVKNKIINLYGLEYKSSTTITTEGHQYGSWYGYVADGYYTSREEIDNSEVLPYGGNRANVYPGYIKYKDISGIDGVPDGKIDSYDRTIIGNPTPRYEYGLNLGLEWKGIDLSALFQGVGKKDIYYSGAGARALSGNYTIYKYQLDTWTEDNPNAKFPLLLADPNGTNPNNMISSFWVKSGAYCRLKNLVIGYSIPKKWTYKAQISKIRVYASAQNILTFSQNFYEGFDPESSVGSGATMYPINKTFLLGLNVEF